MTDTCCTSLLIKRQINCSGIMLSMCSAKACICCRAESWPVSDVLTHRPYKLFYCLSRQGSKENRFIRADVLGYFWVFGLLRIDRLTSQNYKLRDSSLSALFLLHFTDFNSPLKDMKGKIKQILNCVCQNVSSTYFN